MRSINKSVLFAFILCFSLFAFGCNSSSSKKRALVENNGGVNGGVNGGENGDENGDGNGDVNGGANGNQNDLLEGSYFMGLFFGSVDGENIWYGNQALTLDIDGEGGCEGSIIYDSNGDIGDLDDGDYTVDMDGELTFGGSEEVGIVSVDGSVFSTVLAEESDDLYFSIAVKKSTGMDKSNLTGDFLLLSIIYSSDDDTLISDKILFTFDGEGVITDGEGPLGTYEVEDDGAVTLTLDGIEKTFLSQLSPNGNLMVMLDSDDDDEVMLTVGIKQWSGANASDLSGEYRTYLFAGDDESIWTNIIDFESDGDGTITPTFIAASDGDMPDIDPVGYAVAGNGTFEIEIGAQGILSPDREIFAFINDPEEDPDTMLAIGIKKP